MRIKALQIKLLTRVALLVLFFVGQISFSPNNVFAAEPSCAIEAEETSIRNGGSVLIRTLEPLRDRDGNIVNETDLNSGRLKITNGEPGQNRFKNAITNGNGIIRNGSGTPNNAFPAYSEKDGDFLYFDTRPFEIYVVYDGVEACSAYVTVRHDTCSIPGIKFTKTANNKRISLGVVADVSEAQLWKDHFIRFKVDKPFVRAWNSPSEAINRSTQYLTFAQQFDVTETDNLKNSGTIEIQVFKNNDEVLCNRTVPIPPLDSIPVDSDPLPNEDELIDELTSPYKDFCKQAGPEFYAECEACMGKTDGVTSTGDLWTAFGCIPVGSGTGLLSGIFKIGMGLAGGFALLLILFGAFQMTTSAGDPQKLQGGQEVVVSAIIGLFFIILSIVILQFIGINILGIPGLS